jgi:uncharacterized protein YidB (DUF937 family)
MSFFDQVLGGLVGKLGSPEQKGSLLDLAVNVVKDHPGGLSGMVQQFQASGLADQVKSWVGTGQNQTVTADQVGNALGSQNIQKFGQKLGISPQIVSAGLAALLPVIIDHLTPKGQVEPGIDLQAALKTVRTKLTA